MAAGTTGQTPSPRRRRAWRALAWVAGTLALLALLWTLAIGWALPRWLKSRLEAEAPAALGAPLAIERIEIAPWTLDARVHGLRLGPAGAPWLALDELRGVLSLESLRRLAPVLERVQVRAPRVELERLDATHFNVTPLLDAIARRPASPEPPRFALHNIEIEGGRVHVVDRVTHTEHLVDGLRLGVPFLSTLPSQVAIDVLPRLDATVDGSRFHLEGRTQPFNAGRRSALELRWQAIDLAHAAATLSPLLGTPLPVALRKGALDLALSVAFEQRAAPAPPLLQVTGRGAVSQLEASVPAQALRVGWDALAVDGIDVRPLERQAVVGTVELRKPVVELDLGRPPTASPPSAASRAPAPAAAASAPAWQWRVGKVGLVDGRVRLAHPSWAGGAQVLDAVQATLAGLDGRADAPDAKIDASFADARGARGTLAGTLGVGRPHAALDVAASGVDAVPWLAPWAARLPVRVASARVSARGRAEVQAAGWSLHDGSLRVEGLSLRPADAQAADRLALPALQASGVTLDASAGRPLQARVATLALDRLDVEASRDAHGRFAWLPPPGDATPAAAAGAAPHWRLDELRCNGCALAFTDRSVRPAASVALAQADVRLAGLGDDAAAPVAFELAAQAARGRLAVRGRATRQPLSLQARVDANGVDLAWLQPYLDPIVNVTVARAKASAAGELKLDGGPREALASARWRGRLALADVRALDKVNAATFVRLKSASLDGADLAWRPGATEADLGAIALDDFYGRVIINPDGRLNLRDIVKGEREAARSVTTPAPAGSSAAAPAAAGTASAAPLHLRWRGIRLAGGEVDFTDNFIRPNYSARLTDVAGDVAALAWNDPQPAQVHVAGKVDGSAPLEITGTVNPLGARLHTDLTASARGIDITRLSTYSARYAGYGIEKGTLSAKVHYRVDNGKLEAQNNLVLDQLTFGPKVESPDALKLPVLLAVSLLKDRNGVIDVDLPISGSLDDPQFSLGGVIARVIVNLITKAVTAPFTLLAHAFGGADQQLGWVEFAPGSARLDDAATARLETLAKALADRPALKLEVTGRADPAVDVPALRERHVERLIRLAKARAAGEPPDRVTVEPAERARWLEAAYEHADLKDKPRNALGLARSIPPDQMEALLRESAKAGPAELKALADERADRVKAWLATRVAPERVLVTASQPDASGIGDAGRTTRAAFALK